MVSFLLCSWLVLPLFFDCCTSAWLNGKAACAPAISTQWSFCLFSSASNLLNSITLCSSTSISDGPSISPCCCTVLFIDWSYSNLLSSKVFSRSLAAADMIRLSSSFCFLFWNSSKLSFRASSRSSFVFPLSVFSLQTVVCVDLRTSILVLGLTEWSEFALSCSIAQLAPNAFAEDSPWPRMCPPEHWPASLSALLSCIARSSWSISFMEFRENWCNPWSELPERICSADGFVVVLLEGLACISKTERVVCWN